MIFLFLLFVAIPEDIWLLYFQLRPAVIRYTARELPVSKYYSRLTQSTYKAVLSSLLEYLISVANK